MHYLLFYDLAPDYLERRGEYRAQHLALAWAAQERGELILAGALDEPADRAVFFFQCASPDVVAHFVWADPYVINGLVLRWTIRPWRTVVGDLASTPVRPGDPGSPPTAAPAA